MWKISNKNGYHPRTSALLAIKLLAFGGKALPEEDAYKERCHRTVLRILCKALQASDFQKKKGGSDQNKQSLETQRDVEI